MKGIWATSSVLWLGVALGSGQAQDTPLRSAVSLGRPMPAASSPVSWIRPTAYNADPIAGTPTVVRAKGPETNQPLIPPLPLPSGQPESLGPPTRVPGGTDQPIASTPNAGLGQPTLGPGPMGDGIFATDPWLGAPGCCGEGGGLPACCGDCFSGLSCLGVGSCGPCGCGPSGGATRFWSRAEVLLWNISNSHIPPLVTTSSPQFLGVLGQGDTTVLLGGTLDHEGFTGGRFTVGGWLDPCNRYGAEATYFFLGRRSIDFNAGSNGTPLLARPFFDANPASPGENSELIANPPVAGLPNLIPLNGSVRVSQSTELWGIEANGVWNCWRGCWGHLDLLAGFRYLQLKEELDITENLTVPLTSTVVPGETIFVNDHFGTRNQFYGGQVGFRAETNWRHWTLDFTSKFALGTTHQQVNINGATIITPPGGAPTAFTGGLLALPTNIGHYSRDHFSVVPEAGLNIGYCFNDHWRVYAGYSFIYWNSVVRPGDQIDRVVNSSQLPAHTGPFVGPARPAFTFRETDFWAHGVNIGLEFKY